jgi:protein phosphatase 1L
MKKNLFLFATILIFKFQHIFAMGAQQQQPHNLSFSEVFQQVTQETTSSTTPNPKITTKSDSNIYSISYIQGNIQFEDAFDLDIDQENKFAFFGIFDGHGGNEVSQYLENNLLNNCIKEKSIPKGFAQTDSEILKINDMTKQGSTAITAFIAGKILYVANVGDSRGIISINGQAKSMSKDHTENNASEKIRIENAGGRFYDGRVAILKNRTFMGVTPTRSFGDYFLKQYIISTPEIEQIELSNEHEYLILASDGLWDVVGNKEAINLVTSCKAIQAVSEELIKLATLRKSDDDITVIVVDLKKLMESLNSHE